jgi:hypothetical protein
MKPEARARITSKPPKYGDKREGPDAARKPRGRSVTWGQVFSTPCRHCGAGIGWPCFTPTGYTAKTHGKRMDDAEAAQCDA